MFDTRLATVGQVRRTPEPPPGTDAFLYVFSGAITAERLPTLSRGDGLRWLGARSIEVAAIEPTELVLFFADRGKKHDRSGAVSG